MYLILMLLLLPFVLDAQSNCKFRKTANQISVYTCERNDSNLNSVKATFQLDTTPSQYASIMLDIDKYKEWNLELSNTKIIKLLKNRELIYYFEVDAPWPIKDRFCVLRLKVEQDPTSKVMFITQDIVPEMMSDKNGLVAIKEFHSILTIIPISKNRYEAEFFLKIDPGGVIPDWLTNMVTTRMPIKTYSNIFKRARELDQLKNEGSNNTL